MEFQIIAFYFFADTILKASHFYDDPQSKMTNAEIITAVLTSARFFGGNQRCSIHFLREHNYIPNCLSEGHFNYRLHRIPIDIWQKLFSALSEYFKRNHTSQEDIVDSFPVPCCDNIRIFRTKIFSGKKYRGYVANKKRYFYGLRVHVLATTNQEPVEFLFTPGSENDISAFKRFNLDLPRGAIVYGDKAYNSYDYEDFLKENDVHLVAERRENSKRSLNRCLRYVQNFWRKRIETTFSRITSMFPKNIHAVTSQGFELKIVAFILAYSCCRLL